MMLKNFSNGRVVQERTADRADNERRQHGEPRARLPAGGHEVRERLQRTGRLQTLADD